MTIMKIMTGILLLPFLFVPPLQAREVYFQPQDSIVINLPSRTLCLYSGDALVKEYAVAVGRTSTPTPVGDYEIMDKEVNPCWYPPDGGDTVASGPGNPLGYRWMEFLSHYGIHGTNVPGSIGQAVSGGCIRMREEDVEDLFDRVTCGTPVHVTYERVVVKTDGRQVSVGVYSDLYDRDEISLADIKAKLAERDLAGVVDDATLLALLDRTDEQVKIADLADFVFNGHKMKIRLIFREDGSYVPVWPIASMLQQDLGWDEASGLVASALHTVPGLDVNDILYIRCEDIPRLFGGTQIWDQVQQKLYYQQEIPTNKRTSGNFSMSSELRFSALPNIEDGIENTGSRE